MSKNDKLHKISRKEGKMQTKRQTVLCRAIVVLAIVYGMACVTPSSAQVDCEAAVTEAQRLYEVGLTADIILLLERCLPDGIPNAAQQLQAYKFLALAYIAEDQLPSAREAVEHILDLNKTFEPDRTTDPSKFIEFVDEAKEARSKKKTRKRRWWYIGGGTVLAGAITAVIILTKGEPEPPARLPDPPTFPVEQ
jgi:hypothetical protein